MSLDSSAHGIRSFLILTDKIQTKILAITCMQQMLQVGHCEIADQQIREGPKYHHD
jgi:hypothetical protein